jgi:hypothetical protein
VILIAGCGLRAIQSERFGGVGIESDKRRG